MSGSEDGPGVSASTVQTETSGGRAHTTGDLWRVLVVFHAGRPVAGPGAIVRDRIAVGRAAPSSDALPGVTASGSAAGAASQVPASQVSASQVLGLQVSASWGPTSPGLVLDDAKISRCHAWLEARGDALLLVDAGSRNGTFVNGRRLARGALRDGDVLRLGGTLLVVQRLDAVACERLVAPSGTDHALIGDGHRIEQVRASIRAMAPERFPILIAGESGVGKERVAEAIHRASGRPGPLVAVNCASLTEPLAEAELFGHVAGAFTGAVGARAGLVREARRGTLFLDEIGDMRLPLQATLLRALDSGEVRPVGASRPEHVDVRIVAASNVDLASAVEAGRFRADLHARLLGGRIEVPPLRARREDVLCLAAHFLRDRPVQRWTADAAEALLIHDWPYNVRELMRVVQRAAVAAGDGPRIDAAHLPDDWVRALEERVRVRPPGDASSTAMSARDTACDEAGAATEPPDALLMIQRDVAPTAAELETVLRHHQSNVARVAAFFRKDRRQIYRWAARHGVDVTAYRPRDPAPRE